MTQPLVQLPPDSDLRATEALYNADDLADLDFVYREMLSMRSLMEVVHRARVADQRVASHAYAGGMDAQLGRVVLALYDAHAHGLLAQARAALACMGFEAPKPERVHQC